MLMLRTSHNNNNNNNNAYLDSTNRAKLPMMSDHWGMALPVQQATRLMHSMLSRVGSKLASCCHL